MNQHLDENVYNFVVKAKTMQLERIKGLKIILIAYLSTNQNPKALFEAQQGSNVEATRQVTEIKSAKYLYAEKTSVSKSGMLKDPENGKGNK